jgi:hypothetical protein
MTKRARLKGRKATEQFLGAGASVREYGVGVVGPDPRLTDVLLLVVFAIAIALSFVFLGVIIIPGVLLVAAIHGAIDRPTSVAVTNQGIAVLVRSEFNGRPRKLLTVLPHSVLTDGTVRRSRAYVHLPNYHFWFRTKEYDRLLAAIGANPAANQWTAPIPPGAPASTPRSGGPTFEPPRGSVALAPPLAPNVITGSPAAQPENGGGVIYCSWCGKERSVNAQAIHYCGSMERPSVYCMKCGTSFEGAATCTSCGTPATQISR